VLGSLSFMLLCANLEELQAHFSSSYTTMSRFQVACVHRIDHRNTGDMVSSPCHYFHRFDFDGQVNASYFDINSLNTSKTILSGNYDAVIIGGGGLISCNEEWDKTLQKLSTHKMAILWAPGLNFKSESAILTASVPKWLLSFELVGLRDDANKLNIHGFERFIFHLDDVTCYNELFDDWKEARTLREVGIVSHRNLLLTGICHAHPRTACLLLEECSWRASDSTCSIASHMMNTEPLETLIPFLATSAGILTSSFHVLWWATLLGRPCVFHHPKGVFLSKIELFPHHVTYYSGNFSKDITLSRTVPTATQACRQSNAIFAQKFYTLLSQIGI